MLAKQFNNIIAEARGAVDEIRDHIEDLKTELARIGRIPDDQATILAKIEAAIAEGASEAGFYKPTGIEIGGADDIAGLFDRKFAVRPFVALAVLVPERLRELLATGIPTNGMAPDKRAVMLDDIKGRLLSAEIAEELACREMDQVADGHFPRRADADPAILLAPTKELE